ncbi:MAG: folate-binding protein YgfZ [Cellvibrionaceae bacterium]|jgi:folate-binding protein YgfZ
MPLEPSERFIDISDHSLLLIKGPDAKKFLQGQVTCDVNALTFSDDQNQTSLGAHCTHKGRMLFSFRACMVDDDTIGLAMHKDLIHSALSALKKYSIFSKVELIDGGNDYLLIGFVGNDASSLKRIIPCLPDLPNHATQHQGMTAICISKHRYECWVPKAKATTFIEQNSIQTHSTQEDANTWTALNIADGIGEVRVETMAEFIPQMLNYQIIGNAISFKKGCYTGQEVVARMHYLGKLKRHMYRFSTDSDETIKAGMPLYTPDSTQPIGQIVIGANINNGQECLAVVTEDAYNHDKVHLGDNYEHKLRALPLPYAITKE